MALLFSSARTGAIATRAGAKWGKALSWSEGSGDRNEHSRRHRDSETCNLLGDLLLQCTRLSDIA